MTALRRDLVWISGSWYQPTNAFMNELRTVPYLDSRKDKICVMDVDCIVRNYATDKLVLIEDKAFMSTPNYSEMETLKELNAMFIQSPNYMGMFLLQHEHKGCYDGYNQLSYYKNDQWHVVTSASMEQLTGDNVFYFIKK